MNVRNVLIKRLYFKYNYSAEDIADIFELSEKWIFNIVFDESKPCLTLDKNDKLKYEAAE